MAAIAAGAAAGAAREDPSAPRAAAAAPTRAALDRAIGQHIVTSFAGTGPDAQILRLARQGRIGGVILFGPNIRSVAQVRRAVSRLQAAARAGGHPPLIVAVDQEGGAVKRFRSLPPRRTPRAMRTPAVALAEGRATGAALKRAGVNVDLAPVADVTGDRRSFLYPRSFASPTLACAFARGLKAGGVLPTLKHFPGLGGAPQNTDDAAVTLRTPRATLVRRAAAYRSCGDAGLVMVNSARYAALGPGPAVLRPATYALLRDLDVEAPTITDALQAQALASYTRVPTRAVRAGADLLLSTGSQDAAADIYLGLAGASRRGELGAARIMAGAERIARLKRYFR